MLPAFAALPSASRLTGVSTRTIKSAYEAGRVRAIKDGRRVKYSLDDVYALAQPKRVEAPKRLRWKDIMHEYREAKTANG